MDRPIVNAHALALTFVIRYHRRGTVHVGFETRAQQRRQWKRWIRERVMQRRVSRFYQARDCGDENDRAA